MNTTILNKALKLMLKLPSIEKRKLKATFRNKLHVKEGIKLSNDEANKLVEECIKIHSACFEIAKKAFTSDPGSMYFEKELFYNYPDLDPEIKSTLINMAMFAQFR